MILPLSIDEESTQVLGLFYKIRPKQFTENRPEQDTNLFSYLFKSKTENYSKIYAFKKLSMQSAPFVDENSQRLRKEKLMKNTRFKFGKKSEKHLIIAGDAKRHV
jgi:hypothetical protein